jgi:hypothetical protein
MSMINVIKAHIFDRKNESHADKALQTLEFDSGIKSRLKESAEAKV